MGPWYGPRVIHDHILKKAPRFRKKGASLEVRKKPGSNRPWIYSIWHNSVCETGIVAQTELALGKSVRSKS
jgi:hypothetical protein